ncbi:heptosyltransferase-1 [Granulicella pectinivorans]|uniref:Heptosyltransferase-1 n=1 Tax=Granulicella pectinivorans TaxID=474950 RepID=A0A1I6MYY9_9BACT|nr:glycosyltransferase family 9 protein [Granulicella pectinivorans]SFS20913.1 heptosyltransferase-1 [Granulicella pectinivorans]
MIEGTPNRVLIVRVGAMGDIVHALPAVAALRRARAEWLIDWAAEGRWSDLLVSVLEDEGPVVDAVVPVRVGYWKAHGLSVATLKDVLALRRWMRAARFDRCVDLQGSVRSAVIGWMAGTRLAGSETPRESPARWLYKRRVRTASVHVVDQACEILGAAVGVALEAGAGPVPFPEDEAAEQWCDAFLADIPAERGYVVLAPTAGWGAKEWPAERFGELAGRLCNAGWTVLVNLTNPKSKPEVVEGSEGRALVLDCSIAQLTAVLRRSSLFIGGDTGPLHLADALGVACVGLFGPTDPARNGPYFGMKSGRARVLRDTFSVTNHARIRETEAGLSRIGVDEVFRAARELLPKLP